MSGSRQATDGLLVWNGVVARVRRRIGGAAGAPRTERVRSAGMGLLRDVRDEDLDVLFGHWVDPEANRMAAFTAADPSDRDAFDARWARLRRDPSVTTRTIDVEGEVVGTIASWDNAGRREVTYWLGRGHWGRGIATRALRAFLEVERARPLYGAAARDNAGSIRVLEKCGFVPVEEGRAFAHGRGEEVDEVILRLDA